MKKTISIILAILMIVGTMPFALAVEEEAGTDIIDATNMTADELKDAVDAALAAGYTAISVNLVEDAESDMFSAITAPLAADGIEEGSIDLTISGATTVPDYTFAAYEEMNENYRACAVLRSVTLTDATTIGEGAFAECKKMTYFSAPKAITIAYEAFSSCYSLIKVNLPSARTIGLLAFASCGALKEVSLPECTSIGDSAFISCFEMETIYAPKVTTIGSYAFQGCESALKTLTLGAVTSVEHNLYGIFHKNNEDDMKKIDLFLSCEQKAMAYNSSTKYWTATGEAFDFGSTNEFIGYTFKSVTLAHPAEADDGDCTTAVKCANCDETAIEAKGNHVSENPENKATCQKKAICDLCGTEYGDKDTLNHKDTLVQVDAKAPTCTEIGYDAYEYCTVCDYTTYEEKEALGHDWSNKDGVCVACGGKHCGKTETDKVVWFYDEATKTITISGTGAMADYEDYDTPWYNYQNNITKVVIENGVTTIGEFAFDSCESLTSVTIGEGVTTIGKYAFSYCTELTSVTIPDSVTTIGKYAFAECSSLTSVTIGEGVTTIGDFAFQNCESLTKIDLNNVEIGNNAFDGCKSVTEVNLDNCTIGIDTFLDLSSLETLTCKNTDIPNYAFHTNKSLKTVTISGGEIGEGAFAECDALSSLNISGVETIGEHAFYKCIALVKIDLSDVEIGDNAFDGCKSVTEINLDNCTIGISTFLGLSSLETLTCKDTDIPDYAFYMNTSLKTVTISGGEIGEGAFGICDTLKEISIANDVIGKLAFYSCKHLETIDVDTAKISESAFALCDSLKNIKLGDELKIIENSAFNKCSKLTEIVIPASVTSIDGYAFYDCSELKYIFFEGTEDAQKTIGDALETNAKIHYGSSTHTFEENYTVDLEPTCTEKGSKSQHCKYCDLTQNSTDIDELGHTPVKGSAEYAHTICDVCKEPLSTTHNFTSKITTAPTCTEEGVETFTCECGYTYTKPIEAKGHDIVIDKAVEATCTATGLTEGSHCSRCDDKTVRQEVVSAIGHKTSVINKRAATCTADGYTGDTYCSNCKTTTVKGSVIKAKGHTEVTVTGKAATCTDTGLTDGKKCSVCGKTTVEQQIISAKGHDIVTDKAVAATCTKTGLTEGSHCSRCSGATVKQEVVPATGHTTSVINKKDATCTAEGYTGDTQCTVCKTVTAKGTAVEKIAHKTTVVGAKKATAKEAGYTGDTKCTVCGTVTAKGTTIAKLTLAAPKVTQKNTAKGISLTWGKVENAESYRVYRRTYNTKTKKYSSWTTLSKAQKGTSYVDTKVKLGTTYSYMVKAINSGVLSKGTPTKNLKYNVTPTVKVVNASKGISVSWSPIANATGYEVYSSTYNAKTKKWSSFTKRATAKANAKSWTDTKAKSGTKYKYTVKALNGKVASAYNKSGVQIVRLAQPTTKIVNASNGIKVSWNKISGATSYEILRAEYNAKTKKWNKAKKVATAKSSATSWTDTKVKSGVQYRYTVKAVNGKVYSSYKTTSGLMFLTMPKTTVKAVKTGVTVTWTQSTGATSYEVYRAEYNKKTKKYSGYKKVATAKSTAKKWTDTKAKKGVKYKYTVKAVNGKVASAYKAVVVSR